MSETQCPVILEGVGKWYGQVLGVNQVDLTFSPGITGLLGSNGAGKSTLIRLICGQLKPQSGTVRVMGRDPFSDSRVFRHLGYCPDSESLYDELSAFKFVQLMARLSGFSSRQSTTLATERLELVELQDAMHRPIRSYSKGMRQRTKLAAALLHDPQILLLDEPLNGLDPMGRLQMLDIFRLLGRQGKTVIVSSHILHEIENLTQRVVLMSRGKVLAEGGIGDIRALIENQPLTLQIKADRPRAVAKRLAALEGTVSILFGESDTLTVRSTSPEEVYLATQEAVLNGELVVEELLALDDNLDAVFAYLVKE